MISELRKIAEDKSAKVCDKGLSAWGFNIPLGNELCDFMLNQGESVLRDSCD